jgi:hypothetical protein
MENEIVTLAVIALMATCASAVAQSGINFTSIEASTGDQTGAVTVKNYDIGAVLTESYSDLESLDKSTRIKTASSGKESLPISGFLEASINSNFVGRAHISWRSVDPNANSHGRHAELGRSVEDLVGVFNIEKFVLLWSNSTPGEISTDWMPCV